jgi:predicted dehydrogenase
MNVLIIGLGSIAIKHIAALRKIEPSVCIFALRSSQITNSLIDVQNVFSLDLLPVKPDFVIISNPTSLHEETIKQCLSLQCPLFIEKPVLSDTTNTEILSEEFRHKKVITYVACNMRFHPSLIFLKDYLLASQPRINEVSVYCGSFLPEWRPSRDFRLSYSVKPEMGGGAHLDLVHELDYCYWLFGTPQKINACKTNVSSLNIEAVDAAYYQLMYPDFVANISLNYFRRDARRDIEIVTEDDTLFVDLLANKITAKKRGTLLHETSFQIGDTYEKQMRYFISKITKQESTDNSFDDGVEVLKIALHD